MENIIEGLELLNEFNPMDIKDINLRAKALIKNKYIKLYNKNQNLNINLVPPILSQNMLFTGSIGSGKTNAILTIVDQLINKMNNSDKMIIFDSKGDFKQSLKNFSNANVDVLSNDNLSTCKWNILKEALYSNKIDNIYDEVQEITNNLFSPLIEKEKTNPFFPLAAKNVFYAGLCILIQKYYINSKNPNAITNDMILSYFNKPISQIAKDFASDVKFRTYIDYIGIIDQNTFRISNQGSSVMATLRNFLTQIFIGNFAKQGSFSIKEFIQSPNKKILFIEYDIKYGQILGPIYKTLIDMAIKESLGRKQKKFNTFFVIDEFRLLPKLDNMDSGVNFGRALGTKFIVGIQNIKQIDEIYGPSESRSILSGFLNTINFRTTDKETREYIQSLFGMQTIEYDNLSITGGKQRQSQNVVKDSDILNLNVGNAIISIPVLSKCPICFDFLEYDNYLKLK